MRLGSGSGVESTTPTRRHTDRTPDRSTAMVPTLESPPSVSTACASDRARRSAGGRTLCAKDSDRTS